MRQLGAFFVRRLGAALFVLALMYTAAFVIYWLIPTEPTSLFYNPQHLNDYEVRHVHHLLGLDHPKIVLYFHYLWSMLAHGFGYQWENGTITPTGRLVELPIGPQLSAAVPVTLSLVLGGAVLVVLLAVPLGALAGRRIGSLGDRTITLVTLIGICTHPMVLGLILQSVFGSHLHWVASGGYCPLTGAGPPGLCNGPASWASHLILPWITFALLYLALYTRMVRTSVSETAHEDFVRTARAKGASETRVFTRHILPTAGLRVLTMVGMEIGTAIGICVYIESAFNMHGLAQMALFTLSGVYGNALDLPLILAVVTVITAIVVGATLLVDMLVAVVDPRVRAAGTTLRSRHAEAAVL